MKVLPTSLQGVLLLEPQVFGDDRGFFLESYNRRKFAELGIHEEFVQDNHSFSVRNTLRGLHYQVGQPQGKLVRAIFGTIWMSRWICAAIRYIRLLRDLSAVR